ncbi:MAG: hypothetical protein JSV25_06665 [Spirochaetota bacterium]|nr:MAG: hypothetical protein JSV25_06665 [Spirochaetota bacterium]
MYIYSSLWVGEFFIFLLTASNETPVRILFKEHEIEIKSKKPLTPWKEKIYLYPAILQRKWIDYKFRDRFIGFVKFDNILPLELTYPLMNKVKEPVSIEVRSWDKTYKNFTIKLKDQESGTVLQKEIGHITAQKTKSFSISVTTPGVYSIIATADGVDYVKSQIIFYKDASTLTLEDINDETFKDLFKKVEWYCSNCKCKIYPIETEIAQGYLYKNYIPFKEYIDIEGFGVDYISDFITHLPHAGEFKSGLIHLLNMIRLASIEDELTIITNLFKDDPRFAYFITDKLFLFSMIPIMMERELQKILNSIDDEIIAKSLVHEDKLLILKVLGNISKRRAQFVQDEMNKVNRKEDTSAVKEEMHRIIKTYFEEVVGRVLRIPDHTRILYTVNALFDDASNSRITHTGDLIAMSGGTLYRVALGNRAERCEKYDIELYKNIIFKVCGITESTIYLKNEHRLRYAFIHIYDWKTNIEDSEILEHISSNKIVPIRRISSELIFTVGAIDMQGKPLEQVIRLRVK